MAETEIDARNLMNLVATLEPWYAHDPNVYVWGNMFVYYVQGDRNRHVAPDVFVVFGVPKRVRDCFKIWEEGKGPDVVIELTSRSTRDEDVEDKYHLYEQKLAVSEYFLFDPRGEYLTPALQGYRLREGRYERIEPVEARLPSRQLGLHLEPHGWELRLYDPRVRGWLPTPDEAQAKLQSAWQQAETARRQAEAERQQAEAERAKAETDRDRLAGALEESEAARRKLAAELEAVRRAIRHTRDGPDTETR